MAYFDLSLTARVSKAELDTIDAIIKHESKKVDPRFESVSHFVRCAMIKSIREETERNKKIKEIYFRKRRKNQE